MSSQPSAPDAPPRSDVWRTACLLLLLVVVAIDVKGYRFGGSNHSLQLPHLKHLLEPALYPADPVIASFDGYVTFFFHALVPLARVTGIEPLYFALFVACRFALLGAIYALARLLLRSPAAALVACLLALGVVPSLAGEQSYWPRLTHAEVATPMVLWGLWLHLRGRTLAACALIGLAFDVHALYALYASALLAFDLLLSQPRPAARELLRAAACLLLPAAPALLWALSRHDAVPANEWALWLQTLRERSAVHAFPLSVAPAVYGRYLTLVSLGLLAFFAAPEPERHKALPRFAAAVAALCAIGFVFAELLPVRRVLEAQLLRSTKLLTFFVIVLIADLAARAWRWGSLARVAGGLLVLSLLLEQPAWTAASLLLLLLARPREWPPAIAALAALALVVDAATGASPVGDRFGLAVITNGARDLLASPVVMLCLGCLIVFRAAGSEHLLRALGVLVPALLLGGALPELYRQHRRAVAGEAWNETQAWVRQHTPRDAVVLTPPDREGFRVFSERSIVGEWKDGTQQFFSWAFTREWRRRMEALQVGKLSFETLPPDELAALGRRFGATRLVFPAGHALPFELLYENAEFAAYRLP
jgi:uncharacterized protein DUF6798